MEEKNNLNTTPAYFEKSQSSLPALSVAIVFAAFISAALLFLQRYAPGKFLWFISCYCMFVGILLILVYAVMLLRARCFSESGNEVIPGAGAYSRSASILMKLGNLIQYVVTGATGIFLINTGYSNFLSASLVKLSSSAAILVGALCVFSIFIFIFASRYFEEYSPGELPEATGLAQLFRVGVGISIIIAISVGMHAIGTSSIMLPAQKIISAFLLLTGVELLVGAFKPLFSVGRNHTEIVIKTEFISTGLFTAGANPLQSVANNMERWLGVNFKETWAIYFLKKSFTPIIILVLSVAWLWTSVVMITMFEEGILLRFGRPVLTETLKPGLHIVMPWPIDRVEKVPVFQVNVMGIGYEETKAGASLLWTKSHAQKEYSLMIGNGRDLVSVNSELAWKIGDAYLYKFNNQNPEEALKELAYRVLLFETVGKSLDEMLSENVEQFSRRVKGLIQQEADKRQLGIEVTGFYLKGLHPPVNVASEYQAVESARIDKQRTITTAQAYNFKMIPRAESTAVQSVNDASSYKLLKKSEAVGQAMTFTSLYEVYYASPILYRFRNRIKVLEESLSESNVYIVDERLITPEDPPWIDYRK